MSVAGTLNRLPRWFAVALLSVWVAGVAGAALVALVAVPVPFARARAAGA